MARREYTSSIKCAEPECREHAHYVYDTRREQAEAHASRVKHPYRCSRHSKPDEVVHPTSEPRAVLVTAVKVPSYPTEEAYERRVAEAKRWSPRVPERYLPGLFWQVEGERVGSGLMFGPGFRAFASDFPEGTQLRITVEVVLPDVSS